MRRARGVVPSGRPTLPSLLRPSLHAIVAVRDGAEYLPGFLANVEPHVDAIVALDDGSTDGSAELLRRSPKVVELLRNPRGREWDDAGNHRRLVTAARVHGARWVVALDVDERVERQFRVRAERVIRRGRLLGIEAFSIRLRELWGSADLYRADGIWGRKTVARIFRLRSGARWSDDAHHPSKAPLDARRAHADLELYHLAMLTPELRAARRRKWQRLDPGGRWQPRGYDYLTDERGLELLSVDPDRRAAEPTGSLRPSYPSQGSDNAPAANATPQRTTSGQSRS